MPIIPALLVVFGTTVASAHLSTYITYAIRSACLLLYFEQNSVRVFFFNFHILIGKQFLM